MSSPESSPPDALTTPRALLLPTCNPGDPARSWRRRTDVPSARIIAKGAHHDAAAPPHDRGSDPPQPLPSHDPTLHQVGRRLRPVLPRLARGTRARAPPLLPAPPGPGATGLLQRPEA